LRRDLKDIYQFYLDEDTRTRLSNMGRLKRWFTLFVWLMKSLILKLTPARRILLMLCLVLFFFGDLFFPIAKIQNQPSFHFYSFLILFFILMLELKDKLLAWDDLAAGRVVQTAMIPDEKPVLSGWDLLLFTRPANEVGGDLVDYMPVGDGHLGLSLGDVAGKGFGAALLMSKLQATIRAIAPNCKSLAELGTQVNKIFCRDGLPTRFTSLVYIEITPDSGLIRTLNAGHLPPIAITKKSIEEMQRGAPALGILPDANYEEQRIELRSGEVMLVYSDGLIEARDERGQFFGEARLMELLPKLRGLSADAMGSRLLGELGRFVGDAQPSDDLSFILLKRTQ
jgi:serine phosphatase RsbU (regulator of sigma subunit)